MEISRIELESTYKSCGDEELIQRLQSGALTELAQEVAHAELQSRGLTLPDPGDNSYSEAVGLASSAEAKLMTIARYTYPTEAHLVSAFLRSEGIYSAVIGGQYMQVTTPWEVNALGGVRLMVPAGQFDRALALLEEFKSGEFELPDDSDPT